MRFLLAAFLGVVAQCLAAASEPLCAGRSFEGASYTICTIDLTQAKLELFNLNSAGQPYASFDALADGLGAEGRELIFAMNAGMFDENLRPIGLYVEDGTQVKKLNRRNGYGNFHMKPNGVFYVKDERLGVVTSDQFASLGIAPDFATQSGPMLVMNGEIHPKFSETGTSRKVRNGVGMVNDHMAVFAISEDAVTFHQFAKLFRDGLSAPNALFFDGTVSSLYAPELGRLNNFVPLGPMVGAVKTR
jgi:uncharacterized protein YigE (DUF2233 family)